MNSRGVKVKKRYDQLLADTAVRRWSDNIARGSPLTAEVYLRLLGRFCAAHCLSPVQLAKKDQDTLYNMFLDHVGAMAKRGAAGKYIASVVKGVRSWLAFNHLEVKGAVKVRGERESPTLVDERVPTQEELKRIFLAGDMKSRNPGSPAR